MRLQWAQNRDDRACWAHTALLKVDVGDVAPFIYFDEELGAHRNVRVALAIPGNKGGGNQKEALMNDDRFREQINKLCRAGAVVVRDNQRDPSDLLLVSEDINLRDRLRCAGLYELQEQGLIVLWEPFVNEALETSTPVFGEDEASVKLRKKHAVFWRMPCVAGYKGDPDVVDGIPCVKLGTNRSFEVDPEVLEASNRREAARRAAKGRGRRGR